MVTPWSTTDPVVDDGAISVSRQQSSLGSQSPALCPETSRTVGFGSTTAKPADAQKSVVAQKCHSEAT